MCLDLEWMRGVGVGVESWDGGQRVNGQSTIGKGVTYEWLLEGLQKGLRPGTGSEDHVMAIDKQTLMTSKQSA